MGNGIFEELKLHETSLKKSLHNLYRSWNILVNKDSEDTPLTSEGREPMVTGTWRKPKKEKSDLALNKKEEKKERNRSYPIRIKCSAITYLAALMGK